jgi:hypothetical protein
MKLEVSGRGWGRFMYITFGADGDEMKCQSEKSCGQQEKSGEVMNEQVSVAVWKKAFSELAYRSKQVREAVLDMPSLLVLPPDHTRSYFIKTSQYQWKEHHKHPLHPDHDELAQNFSEACLAPY